MFTRFRPAGSVSDPRRASASPLRQAAWAFALAAALAPLGAAQAQDVVVDPSVLDSAGTGSTTPIQHVTLPGTEGLRFPPTEAPRSMLLVPRATPSYTADAGLGTMAEDQQASMPAAEGVSATASMPATTEPQPDTLAGTSPAATATTTTTTTETATAETSVAIAEPAAAPAASAEATTEPAAASTAEPAATTETTMAVVVPEVEPAPAQPAEAAAPAAAEPAAASAEATAGTETQTAEQPEPVPAEPAPAAAAPEPEPEPQPEPTATAAAEGGEAAEPAAEQTQTAALPQGAPIEGQVRIEFAEGSADLPEPAMQQIDAIVERLAGDENARVQLLAYASGTPETASRARRISLSRALAVRSYLISKGVRSTRMDVRALGNTQTDGPADRVDIIPQAQ